MDEQDAGLQPSVEAGGPLTRVDYDGRGPRTRYEEFEVGTDLGSLDWSVSMSQVRGLMENDIDFHEWYMKESPFGPPVVPPLATFLPVRILFTRKFNVRGLFYMFDCEFHEPIFYDETITVTGHIDDKWIKRDREYVSYVATGTKPDGTSAFVTRRAHVLDYIPRTVPRAGVGLDSGAVVVASQ